MHRLFAHPSRCALAAAALCLSAALAAAPADLPHPAAPATVSAEMAALVNAPAAPLWLHAAKDNAEISAIAKRYAEAAGPEALAFARSSGVDVRERTIGDVPVFELAADRHEAQKPENDERAGKVVLYLHGGDYILGHGAAGIAEAVPLAAQGWRVVCPDYRMAPEHPFPAAVDDALAVYRALIEEAGAENIAVFGSSTGGAMTLILALQAVRSGVPTPAALIAGTPWTDLSKCGDTYATNAGVDNILTHYEGLLASAVKAYAKDQNLKDPLLSPVYAEADALRQFPPTLLISGTRDLFLSNTVRMHQRLLAAEAPAELIVYEAQSHVQYYLAPNSPEAKTHYGLLNRFLKEQLFARGR